MVAFKRIRMSDAKCTKMIEVKNDAEMKMKENEFPGEGVVGVQSCRSWNSS